MPVQLNHTIVHCSDQNVSAHFLTELLGLPDAVRFGPFLVVEVANGVSLDYMTASGPITGQHYAFLVTEEEFDEIFGRIQERGLDFWADPFHSQPGQINRNDGGRGVYWNDPDGHALEIITRPYGSGS
ncbi:VOC family protein [Lentzea sp. JNUCC 0626]|uniref:VOC family protein n=1 Tax=Lentzea sp. JNUCC 0626 TaxID=3367513 RepID=UPI00374A2606